MELINRRVTIDNSIKEFRLGKFENVVNIARCENIYETILFDMNNKDDLIELNKIRQPMTMVIHKDITKKYIKKLSIDETSTSIDLILKDPQKSESFYVLLRYPCNTMVVKHFEKRPIRN